MLRIDVEPSTRAVLVYLDVPERERLVKVLADWLGKRAGVVPEPPDGEDLAWILELRRLLLSPEEPAFLPEAVQFTRSVELIRSARPTA